MRKNILALSIATMIGGLGVANAAVIDPSANNVLLPVSGAGQPGPGVAPLAVPPAATQLAGGGIGHSLIMPYYTVQGGNMTVLSIVNTDPYNGKAVKVRFRGGSNSDDVLDFQVFLSPNDHWSAAVGKNPVTGYAFLTTGDKSCTVPPIPASGQSFTGGRLPSYATATDAANMTSEGYVEIFNMADIPPIADAGLGLGPNTASLFHSILHTAGVPRNCNATSVQTAPLTDAASAAAAVALGFRAPTTGLFGNWTVINVAQTTTFSGEMTAVRAVDVTGADGYGNYVYSPQSSAGVVNAGGAINNLTADPLLRTGNTAFTTMDAGGVGATPFATAAITAAFYDLPDMSTPYIPGIAIDANAPLGQAFNLTSALAVKSLTNEYTNESTLTASTDWTFSMPTRRYSVGVAYGNGTVLVPNVRRFSSVATSAGMNQFTAPAATIATQYFHSSNTTLTSAGLICVSAAGQNFFDRDEQASALGAAVFSPGSATSFSFCGETSVTSFSKTTASTLSSLLNPVTVDAFANGWARITTTTPTNTMPGQVGAVGVPPVVSDTTGSIGLPIMGAAFMKLNNPLAASGKSGTYGMTFNHRYTR
jgi:hypothetical protein